MKRWFVGVSVAATFGMAIVAPVQAQAPTKERGAKGDQPITIRGCVKAGEEADTFLLMRVMEVRPGRVQQESVPNDSEGRDVMYWLSSTKGLAEQIGKRVEVRGTIDLSEPKDGETQVSNDSSKRRDATSEMKSEGKTVTVKSDSQPQVAPTTTSETKVKTEGAKVERIVYRLKVESVKRVENPTIVCQ